MSLNIGIHHEVEAFLCETVADDATPLDPADPFGIDHDCLNPAGHAFISDCSELVCHHCGRIAWQ